MLAPEVIQSAERRVGQTICGKWHLDRVIGVGGMAAVYEATHRNRNRVAIKLLHPQLSLDEGTRQRFLREGYVANTIRHSGAVQILDDDVTDEGIAFLVMELLRGESVEERMLRKGGALEVLEALSIADQLLDVLGSAHDQHVVHRDVKPDNVFLTEEGKLKVLDFGIARLHHGDTGATKVGSFMGTPAFCAPEQARGRWDEVDSRTDLFSVGASLFTCLTGTHVHEAETSSEQLALAISASARSLATVMPDAPLELVELVDKALAYEKEHRFQSARAMRAAVRRVMAGLPEDVGKSSTPLDVSSALGAGDQPTDFDSDSYHPSAFPSKPGIRSLLLALLAAGGLAFVLLSLAQTRATEEQTLHPAGLDRSAQGSEVVAASAQSPVLDQDVEPRKAEGPLVEQPARPPNPRLAPVVPSSSSDVQAAESPKKPVQGSASRSDGAAKPSATIIRSDPSPELHDPYRSRH